MSQRTPEQNAKLAEAEAAAAAYRKAHPVSAEVAELMAPIEAAHREAEARPKNLQPEAQPTGLPYTPAEDSAVRASIKRTEEYGGDWYATRNGPGADELDNQ